VQAIREDQRSAAGVVFLLSRAKQVAARTVNKNRGTVGRVANQVAELHHRLRRRSGEAAAIGHQSTEGPYKEAGATTRPSGSTIQGCQFVSRTRAIYSEPWRQKPLMAASSGTLRLSRLGAGGTHVF